MIENHFVEPQGFRDNCFLGPGFKSSQGHADLILEINELLEPQGFRDNCFLGPGFKSSEGHADIILHLGK